MLTIKMLTLTFCCVKFCLSKTNDKITNGGDCLFFDWFLSGVSDLG